MTTTDNQQWRHVLRDVCVQLNDPSTHKNTNNKGYKKTDAHKQLQQQKEQQVTRHFSTHIKGYYELDTFENVFKNNEHWHEDLTPTHSFLIYLFQQKKEQFKHVESKIQDLCKRIS
jgi:hypothetical protein